MEISLVKFVEDHQTDPLQVRVVLQPPGKDALSHHLDTGMARDSALKTDAVANRAANLLSETSGHVTGSITGSQSAGLKHQNSLPGQPRLVEQGQGHASRLARPRFGLQHRTVVLGQSTTQIRQ